MVLLSTVKILRHLHNTQNTKLIYHLCNLSLLISCDEVEQFVDMELVDGEYTVIMFLQDCGLKVEMFIT